MVWLPVLRKLHLFGGGRAFNGMNTEVFITPATVNKKETVIQINKFESLFSDIENLRLRIIGCDFFVTPKEAQGFSPPQWRTKCTVNPIWLCTSQGDEWSFIAHAAFKQKNGLLCDLASRISHQIRACEWRLRELSESYAKQLQGCMQSKSFENGRRFRDGYTSLCYLAFQAFLVEACVLRDYLSEFYWEINSEKKDKPDNRITTLSGLLKKWKSKPPNETVGKEIMASAKSGQWLFELGAYRDLVVHTAPLAHAGHSLFAVTRSFDLSHGERLPGVKLPLPDNPSSMSAERSSGRYFQDPELTFSRFTNALEDVDNARDSLEYAHLCMQLMAAMASSISKISPINPEMPLITPDDVIGEIKIS